MILSLDGYDPDVSGTAFVAPNAAVIGNVSVGDEASIWFGATLRGDNGDNPIVVGARTSIQDGCVVHVSTRTGTIIGDDVTVGHGAILESCTIDDGAVIGMNAVVLERAIVGAGSMIAAGAVVPAGMEIPAGMLAAGVPAQIKKAISGESAAWIERSAAHYVALARRYREQLR
jgi:carbonic anhydrase/acetyltransferase-like protein (isoleucine patch superfamily)